MRPSLKAAVVGVVVACLAAEANAQFPVPPFGPFGPGPGGFPIPRVFVPPWAPPMPRWAPPAGAFPSGSAQIEVTVEDPYQVMSRLQAELKRRAESGQPGTLTAGEAMLLGIDVRLSLDGKTPQSFFGIEGTKPKLQVALVVDATDSMGRDIASLVYALQTFVGLVRSFKADGDVSFALVLYRDTGAPSGTVETLIPRFDRDVNQVQRALAYVRTESGAPYFPEQVDEGVYRALSELDWNMSADTSRWIMLCGDAPPFAEGSPMRHYPTAAIVEAARERDVNIQAILCTSGFTHPAMAGRTLQLFETAAMMRPELQGFLATLTSATGGRLLDLSDPTMMHRLVAAAATPAAPPAAAPPSSTPSSPLAPGLETPPAAAPPAAPPSSTPSSPLAPGLEAPPAAAPPAAPPYQGELIEPGDVGPKLER